MIFFGSFALVCSFRSFCRMDVNFLYSRQNLWKYNGKKIEPYMSNIISLVENERVLTISEH
jgi:hypothetical protein